MSEEALPPVPEEEVPVEEPVDIPEEPDVPLPPAPKSEFIDAYRIEYEVWIPAEIYQGDRHGFEDIARQRFQDHHGFPAAGVSALIRQAPQEEMPGVMNFTVLTVYAYVHSFKLKEAGDDSL